MRCSVNISKEQRVTGRSGECDTSVIYAYTCIITGVVTGGRADAAVACHLSKGRHTEGVKKFGLSFSVQKTAQKGTKILPLIF